MFYSTKWRSWKCAKCKNILKVKRWQSDPVKEAIINEPKKARILLQRKPKRPCICGHGAGWHKNSAREKLMESYPHFNYGCNFPRCECNRFADKK